MWKLFRSKIVILIGVSMLSGGLAYAGTQTFRIQSQIPVDTDLMEHRVYFDVADDGVVEQMIPVAATNPAGGYLLDYVHMYMAPTGLALGDHAVTVQMASVNGSGVEGPRTVGASMMLSVVDSIDPSDAHAEILLWLQRIEEKIDPIGHQVTNPIPASYFSMNVLNEEWGTRWPSPFNFYGARTFKGSWSKVQKIQGGPIAFDYPPVGSHPNARNDGTDSIVGLVEANQSETLMVIGGKPSWYSTIQEIAANIQEYRDYLTAVVTQYKGRVQYYESWNEPEQQGFIGNAQLLVDFTREIYQIVKAIDPSVTVVCPGMNISGLGTVSNLFDEFLSLGGADWCDVIGFHSYLSPQPNTNPPLPPEAIIDRLTVIKDILASHQVTKPLWNTETGYNIHHHDKNDIASCGTGFAGSNLDDETAYGYIPRLLMLSWFHGVERFYWYGYGHRCMGFLEYNIQDLHPMSLVYTELQRWLVGKQMVNLSETNGVWTVEVSDGQYTEYILWTTGNPLVQPLPGSWNVNNMVDVFGKVMPLQQTDKDQFEITPQPRRVYFKG